MQFDNAPLVQVVTKVGFKEPRPLPFIMTMRIAKEVHGRFPHVDNLEGLDVPPAALSVMMPPSSQVHGLFLGTMDPPHVATVQSDMVSSKWQGFGEGTPAYPGFKVMADSLDYVAKGVHVAFGEEAPALSAAQLYYSDLVIAPSLDMGEFAERYLVPDLVPAAIGGTSRLGDYNVGWSDCGMDFRFVITPRTLAPASAESNPVEGIEPLSAYSLDWVVGTGVGDDDLRMVLDKLHGRLMDLFVSSITEYAKEQWGYDKGN